MIEPIPFAGLVDISEPKTKYCSSCLRYKSVDTGRIVITANKNVKRFKCKECLDRISSRLYETLKAKK
jgi:uncharacterized protein YlaI